MYRSMLKILYRALSVGLLVAVTSISFAGDHINSGVDQRFHQGDSGVAANGADIFLSCELGDVGQVMTPGTPIRIQTPAGVQWDTTVTPTVKGGSTSFSRGQTIGAIGFLDATHMSIPMSTYFSPGDHFTVTGIRYAGFVAGSVPNPLLESTDGGTTYGSPVNLVDSFKIRVANNPIASPPTGPGVSQVLSPGAFSVPCSTLSITEPNTAPANGGIWASTGIMITIPSGVGVTWDTGVVALPGSTFGKVNLPLSYTDANRTVVIAVNTDFSPGDQVILNGLQFNVAGAAVDNPGFALNVRIGGLNNISPFHVQCCKIQISGVPKISSAANQAFTVGDLPTSATQSGSIVITETSGTPKLLSGRTVQVIIPAGLHLEWDPSFIVTTSTTGTGVVGAASVTSTGKTNDTLNFPITTSFSSNNTLSITAARFRNFTSPPSGPLGLQLFVTTQSFNPIPTDPHTQAIGQPSISSASAQDFLVSPPGPSSVAMATITVTDDATTPRLVNGAQIKIRIPPTFNMQWGGSPSDGAAGAVLTGKLSGATVAYTTTVNPNDTLQLTLGQTFGASGSGTIGGLHFGPFSAGSLPANLHLYLSSTDPVSVAMADNNTITIGGRPTISTGSNQSFTVNDPSTLVTPFTITDSPSSPSIQAGNTLQVVIPASLNFTWDTSVTSPTVTGSAAGKVTTPFSYSVDAKTLKIPVATTFATSDTLTLSNLKFMNFSAASAPAGLQVTVTATGPIAATDTFSKAVGAPTLVSAQNQVFGKNDPSTLMQSIVVTDDPVTPRLLAGTIIQVWIPPAFNMTWDPAFPPTLGVTGTGTVGAPSFANGNKTLLVPVATSFTPAGPNQTVTISGGHFNNFTLTSGLSSLELFVNGGSPPALPNAFDSSTIKVGTRPNVSSVTSADSNGNGSIDQLIVLFDKPIATTSSVTSGLGFTAAGYTILGGAVAGNQVTFTLRETGLPDTGATPLLTYNSAIGNLVDSADGLGLVSAIPPTADGAAPVIVGFSAVDTNADGHLDKITFTFSENLAPGQEDINDWKIVDADGSTNLLAGLTNANLQIIGNQLVITLAGTTGTDGTPRYRYQDDGLANGVLKDPSGNLVVIQTNNRPPVVNPGIPLSVLPSRVTLNASGSTDPNGAPLTFSWTVVSVPLPANPTVTLVGASTATPSCILSVPGIYTFKVTVSDGLDIASATTTVTVLNSTPSAVAVVNTVVTATTPVSLYGTLSTDVDGDSLVYSWAQLSGPVVVPISNPTLAVASITAPSTAGVYVFELTVIDSGANSSKDQVTVRVNSGASVVPTANAGSNQVQKVGSLVTLDGRLSTSTSGNQLNYSWSPSTLFPTMATSATPTFTPSGAGLFTFQLVVTDSVTNVASPPSTVTVMAYSPGNLPPVAVANKLSPAGSPLAGDLVTLDSSGSLDPEGVPLQYAWSQVSGPAAFLSSLTVAQPVFTPVISGTYTFQLMVSDGVQQSFPALTSFQVLPAVGTGPISVLPSLNSPLLLNGHVSNAAPISMSSTHAAPISDWWWEQISGPAVVLNPSFAVDTDPITFTAPVAGLYRFRLNGLDFADHLRTSTTFDVVVDTAATTSPVANAGSTQTATAGQLVTLDGSASSGTNTLTMHWTQVSGPPVALSNPSATNPSFVPGAAGTYVFALTVSQGVTANSAQTDTTPSFVTVTVSGSSGTSQTGGGGGGGGCGTLGLEPLLLLGTAVAILRRRRRRTSTS
jgi:hypothetical protein